MAVYQFETEGGGSAVLFGNYHGVMVSEPWSQPIQSFQVPGVYGVAHLIDATKERRLSCYLRWQGYASYFDIETALAAIDAYNGVCVGDVFFEGSLTGTFPKCTFLGFDRTSEIKYDGSGQNGWWVEGRLHWIQRTQ